MPDEEDGAIFDGWDDGDETGGPTEFAGNGGRDPEKWTSELERLNRRGIDVPPPETSG